MTTALVTGAGGFIGRNLCHHLAQSGCNVRGIDVHLPVDAPLHDRLKLIAGDFRDSAQMAHWLEGVTHVYHLAAAHLDVRLDDAVYWDVNVHALKPFLSMAREAGVERFVHVSSVGVYGKLVQIPADEETPCHPQSVYGETKLAGEAEVRRYSRENGLPAVIVRPAWVYGPHCPRTLKLYRTLKKRRFVTIGDGNNRRHPVYIEDLNQALMCAAVTDAAIGQTLIIAGEKAVTTNALIQTFCQVMGVPAPRVRIPHVIGRALALAAETSFGLMRKTPPVSRRSLEFFDTENAFHIAKAQRVLGYRPAWSLEEGLQHSLPWLEKGQ